MSYHWLGIAIVSCYRNKKDNGSFLAFSALFPALIWLWQCGSEVPYLPGPIINTIYHKEKKSNVWMDYVPDIAQCTKTLKINVEKIVDFSLLWISKSVSTDCSQDTWERLEQINTLLSPTDIFIFTCLRVTFSVALERSASWEHLVISDF